VFITDYVAVSETGWDKLHVVSIAPLIAEALERVLADGSIRELCEAPVTPDHPRS
jgi:hypothetical protein